MVWELFLRYNFKTMPSMEKKYTVEMIGLKSTEDVNSF
jgi:hypothetical protein